MKKGDKFIITAAPNANSPLLGVPKILNKGYEVQPLADKPTPMEKAREHLRKQMESCCD